MRDVEVYSGVGHRGVLLDAPNARVVLSNATFEQVTFGGVRLDKGFTGGNQLALVMASEIDSSGENPFVCPSVAIYAANRGD